MKLAIVGSTLFYHYDDQDKAKTLIEKVLLRYKPKLVISGGAIGIDAMAVRIATELDIEIKEFKPRKLCWDPDGYKARNILIAKNCTSLLRISCHLTKTYGSGWTADYAEKLGKRVVRWSPCP